MQKSHVIKRETVTLLYQGPTYFAVIRSIFKIALGGGLNGYYYPCLSILGNNVVRITWLEGDSAQILSCDTEWPHSPYTLTNQWKIKDLNAKESCAWFISPVTLNKIHCP